MVLGRVTPEISESASQVSSSVSRDETSLRMEARRQQWLAERGLTPPATINQNEQVTSKATTTWVVPDAAPPGKVVDGTTTGTAPGFKVVNFDRPIPKPMQNEMVMPWKGTVRKSVLRRVADISEVMSIASSKDGDATEPKTVKDLHAFWGKKDREATAAKAKVGSTHSLSKIEAQATLQRHITSGSRIDWDEVRYLRKIIAEAV